MLTYRLAINYTTKAGIAPLLCVLFLAVATDMQKKDFYA